MKKSLLFFILILSFFLPNEIKAQERAKDIPLKITDEEKAAITRILKTVDAKLVYLRYSDSRETYGAARISEKRMQNIKMIRDPGDNGIVIHYRDASVVYLSDGTMIYIAPAQSGRTGQNYFLSVLGKTKMAQLKAILAKYLGAPDTLDAINVKTMDDANI